MFVAYDRGQPVGYQVGELFLEKRAQDDNRNCETGLAKFDAFVERSHGKPPNALADERVSDAHGSMSIRVGLDDGHDLAGRWQIAFDAREVMGERREIDGGVGG